MKNTLLFSFLLSSLLSEGAKANPTCNMKNISSNNQAEQCANILLGKSTEIASFLYGKSHLGDMKKCSTANGKSYFTDKEKDFAEGIANTKLDYCKESQSFTDQYACYVYFPTSDYACYVPSSKKGGVLTDKFYLAVGSKTGALLTAIPMEPSSK